MNIRIVDENNFVLFIIDKKVIPSLEESILSDVLRKIFLKIKEKYNIEIYGNYNVTIYSDNYYGVIIKLEKEELEYLSYYEKQVEMKIIISENQVFYKLDDIFEIDKRILEKSNVYLYNNELYLELNEEINFILLGNLIENSEITYENTNEIKIEGELIDLR